MRETLKQLDSRLNVVYIIHHSQLLELVVFLESKSSKCPECNDYTSKRHSAYMRKIFDLPFQNKAVILHVKSYKWFCENDTCKRKIFTERLPWIDCHRRTKRLEEALRTIVFSTSAVQAEHVCRSLKMPVSHDTLLRLVYRTSLLRRESPFHRYR
ncbi:transposase family protein [Virgibacillus dokdonensis]|uniref:transposase family protein n=1 Tax=Virgibacillus dokdonensis TaxID=302167 RepID=UPI000989BD0E|nr:transposase family protein [Virgibacillus dokdonensis]